MNVPDPNHPWVEAIRRQRQWMFAVLGVCVLVMLGAIIFILLLLRSSVGLSNIIWAVVAALFFMTVLPIAVCTHYAKKQRRSIDLMLASGGLVCPKCCVELGTARDRPAAQCGRCKRIYEPNELLRFWELTFTDPMKAGAWWSRNYGSRWRASLIQFMNPDGRPHIARMVALHVTIWTALGLGVALVTGQSLLIGAFKFWHMMFLMCGFIIFTLARRMRVGESLHCAKCEYERGPLVLSKCPECGFDWNSFGGTVQGRFQRNPRLMLAGAILAALGFALIISPIFARHWQYKLMPTGALIHQVSHKLGFTADEWTELRTRALSPAQQRRLAASLLDKGLRDGYFTTDEDNWFVGEITANKLPSDLEQRYYREMMEIELIALETAKVGEPVKLQLQFTNRFAATNNPQAEALIGGYWIGDNPQPIGRQTKANAGIMLDRTRAGGGKLSNEVSFTPQEKGVMTVRARVWVITVPVGRGSQPIQWQDDGTPVIPAISTWHELREMQKSIDVE